jgi:hypothetical protein
MSFHGPSRRAGWIWSRGAGWRAGGSGGQDRLTNAHEGPEPHGRLTELVVSSLLGGSRNETHRQSKDSYVKQYIALSTIGGHLLLY